MPEPAGDRGSLDQPPSPVTRTERWHVAWLLIAAAIVLLWPTHAWKSYRNVMEAVRLYEVRAIVEDGTFCIDRQIKEYGDLNGRASVDGRAYSDKPIGLSLAAVPAYWAMHRIGSWTGVDWTMQALRYAAAALCVTLPTILIGGVMYRAWRSMGIAHGLSMLGVGVYLFGSLATPYSTQFVGHQPAAVLVFGHFALSRSFTKTTPGWMFALAGLMAGWGAMTDYFSAFAHAIIGLSYARRPRWTGLAWGAFGALIGFAPLLIHNAITFGGPLSPAYAHEATKEFTAQHTTGFHGVVWPRWESVAGLLISREKGLLVLCPYVAMAIAGAVVGVMNPRWRREAIVCAASVLTVGFLACSVLEWKAGWTIGPRHMVSVMPLIMTLVVMAVSRWKLLTPWLAIFGLASGAVMLGATFTLPAFDAAFGNPIAEQTAYLVREGALTTTIGSSIGWPRWWALAVPAAAVLLAVWLIGHAIRRELLRGYGVSTIAAIVAVSCGGWWLLQDHPTEPRQRVTAQAKLAGYLDHHDVKAATLERALAADPSPTLWGAAGPMLVTAYHDMGDTARAREATDRWKNGIGAAKRP
ncbi:MAG TPA: hypothetical protein VG797_10600 [Phycisphaerales bacterium]|nr:hypothetical protein [Phycisphaerales bacterium]